MVGTTPKTRAIGVELRRAREDAGLSARQLATKLGKAHTTIGRWESGDRAPRAVDVATVLSALDAPSNLREELIDLAQDSDERHWIATRLSELNRQLITLLELEREATSMLTVSPLLIPGMLQTAAYAEAIMTSAGVPASEIGMRVAMRVGRHDVLLRERPATLLAITSEHVLEQMIGGPGTMNEQLRALLSFAELPNVTLRVVPTRSGWHPGLEGAFCIREFSAQTPIVSVESALNSQFFHELDHVNAYREAASKVAESALSAADSAELIKEIHDRRAKES